MLKLAEFQLIPLDLLDEPRLTVRAIIDENAIAELARDIEANGLLQPLVVFSESGRYRVSAGHRRLLACRECKLSPVPCMVHDKPEKAMEMAKIAENLYRQDVSPAEEALYFAELIATYDCTEEALCELVHQKPDYVNGRLALMSGYKQVFDALLHKQITLAAARALNQLDLVEDMVDLLDQVLRSGARSHVIREWVTKRNQLRKDGVLGPVVVEAAPPVPVAVARGPFCMCCGSDEHPYHMRPVMIHFYCGKSLKRLLDQAGIGGDTKIPEE